MELSLQVRTWQTREAFVISRGAQDSVETVEVTLHEGAHSGRGEAVGVAYSGETAATLVEALEGLRGKIESGSARADIQTLLPPGGARNALDCAFWDLEAQFARRSVWRLAGVSDPESIPLTATISLDRADAMASAALAAPPHSALKIKLGDATMDIERVREIRRAVPSSVLLCDVNEGWSFAELRELAPELASLGVALIEQPLKAEFDADLADYKSPIPLCADESCSDRSTLGSLGGYAAINIKLDKTGGLTEALALAKAARLAGKRVFVGCMLCTSMGVAPARLLADWGDWFDIDGPRYLTRDRPFAYDFSGGVLAPPHQELWGFPR